MREAANTEERNTEQRNALEKLSLLHGSFNLVTGIWPVLHRRSFEAVTGPKTDFWLVRTVGLLLATTGLVMACAGHNRRVTSETRLLGTGVPASLFAIDAIYGSTGRISRIYLIDALVQAALVWGWCSLKDETRSPITSSAR